MRAGQTWRNLVLVSLAHSPPNISLLGLDSKKQTSFNTTFTADTISVWIRLQLQLRLKVPENEDIKCSGRCNDRYIWTNQKVRKRQLHLDVQKMWGYWWCHSWRCECASVSGCEWVGCKKQSNETEAWLGRRVAVSYLQLSWTLSPTCSLAWEELRGIKFAKSEKYGYRIWESLSLCCSWLKTNYQLHYIAGPCV